MEHAYTDQGLVFIFISFFNEIHVFKHNSPRWNAVFCCVTSGAIMFYICRVKSTPDLYALTTRLQLYLPALFSSPEPKAHR